jgi:hypothetical protein
MAHRKITPTDRQAKSPGPVLPCCLSRRRSRWALHLFFLGKNKKNMSFDQQFVSCLTAKKNIDEKCKDMETNLPYRCQGPMSREDYKFCEKKAFDQLKDPSKVCHTLQSKGMNQSSWTAQKCAHFIEK